MKVLLSLVLTIALSIIPIASTVNEREWTQEQNVQAKINAVPEPTQTPEPTPAMTYLGEFRITRYCTCEICNGQWTGQPTAMGTELTDGRTIAVDPSVIPLGQKVYIEGIGERVAEDTGSAIVGNRIDLFVDASHEEIMDMGVSYLDVYIVE